MTTATDWEVAMDAINTLAQLLEDEDASRVGNPNAGERCELAGIKEKLARLSPFHD